MSADAKVSNAHKEFNPDRLFLLSCVSLIAAAFVFSIRAAILPELATAFNLSQEKVNTAAGAAFLGFALTVFIGSPACDFLGMGRLLFLAGIFHVGGTLGTIFAHQLGGGTPDGAYTMLWASMFTVGLAHGLVEAVINPLAATIYPDNKTHKLNVLHAWWPGGLTVGGLLAAGLGQMHFNWQVKLAVVLIPTAVYVFLLLGQKFPATERVASGVSNGAMFKEAFNPLFLVILVCMLGTAATELAPNQLLATLSGKFQMDGTLILSYVSMLMFALRFFAGSFAHRLSPIGLLWGSCALSAVGLLLLSQANSPAMAFATATLFAVGVCYMWPTMLGITSELFPRGGALCMGLMGTVGNISIYFVLPEMGKIADNAAAALKAGGMEAGAAKIAAAPIAFQKVAIVPMILVVVFGAVWLYLKSRGGYKAIQDAQANAIQLGQGDLSTEAAG